MVGNKSEWEVKNKNERKNVLFLQKCIFFCTFAPDFGDFEQKVRKL